MPAYQFPHGRLVVGRGRGRYAYTGWGRGAAANDHNDTDAARLVRARVRWKLMNVPTITDRKKCVQCVPCKAGIYFRLVDGHGKSFGRRYMSAGETRSVLEYGCQKIQRKASCPAGEMIWFDMYTNVRVVKRQEEDWHSRISRMLKAAHRRGE